MARKVPWSALIKKRYSTNVVVKEEPTLPAVASDTFPVVRIERDRLAAYKQIPLSGLAAVGTAFAQMPEGARTVVQTVTRNVPGSENLFVGIVPNGAVGTLKFDSLGQTLGNFVAPNAQGRQVISSRMRFKQVQNLQMNETVSTVIPPDPMLMVVAVALMTIEKKLDGIQQSVENVLQFMKQEKESRQRGNLDALTEILDDLRSNCHDQQFCALQYSDVRIIKRESRQDLDFYQKQIAGELEKQKGIHGSKDVQSLIDAVAYQFAEYQLACHIYSFSSFLDILLQRNYSSAAIENEISKIKLMAKRYDALYSDCHAQIAEYQRSTIESRIVGGTGAAIKNVGKTADSLPGIRSTSIGKTLIGAGESIGKFNRDSAQKVLQAFEVFGDSRMLPFADNLQMIDTMCNVENAMITDGENLYVLQHA